MIGVAKSDASGNYVTLSGQVNGAATTDPQRNTRPFAHQQRHRMEGMVMSFTPNPAKMLALNSTTSPVSYRLIKTKEG